MKTKIYIATQSGGRKLEASKIEGHLATHFYNDEGKEEWRVTHLPTGWAICRTDSLRRANLLMKRLNACGFDWSLDLQSIHEAGERLNVVKLILQKAREAGLID